MRIPSIIGWLIIAVTLTGCRAGSVIQAREDMQNSKSAYKQCLAANFQDPDKCESAKRIYEADLAVYQIEIGDSGPAIKSDIDVPQKK